MLKKVNSPRIRLILVGLLFALTTSGCSLFSKSTDIDKVTPEMKAALKQITAEYIGAAIDGNFRHAQSLILWSVYLANKEGKYSKVSHLSEMQKLKDIGAVEQNPLLGLSLVSVETQGEEASVIAKKLKTRGAPEPREVIVKLLWVGQGWLIIDDNIFGKTGLVSSLEAPEKHAADTFAVEEK
ncbi:MAG: hypothetical protein PHC51_05175 [bacterium]|nr:hypothetical protein [bacterium]